MPSRISRWRRCFVLNVDTPRRFTNTKRRSRSTAILLAALANLGRCKTYIGLVDDAISAQENAIRLSPRDPNRFNWYFRIGEAHLLQSRVDHAIDWLEKARSGTPALWYVHAWLAAAYAQKGNLEHARANFAQQRVFGGPTSSEGLLSIAERFVTPEIRAHSKRPSSQACTAPPRHLDGVDAPRRHRCAKVVVLSNHQGRRPWARLAR